MNILNQFFDKIYCINLDHRTDRWDECVKTFEYYGLDVERVSAVMTDKEIPGLKNGMVSLITTTIHILEDAKKNNYKNFLLLEDDVEFCDYVDGYNGESFAERFEKNLCYLPDNWKLFYLGSGIDTNEKSHVGGEVYRVGFANTAHSLGFNNCFYDICLDKLKSAALPNDIIYSNLMREGHDIYSFYPNLTSQRPSFSNLEGMNVNYGHLRNYYSLNK
jgi:hypothetical protein